MPNQIWRTLPRSPIHPVLLSIYPVLALYYANIQEVDLYVIWRPMVVGIIAAILLWAIFHLLIRDLHRSAILTSLSLVLYYSYGHMFDTVRSLGGIALDIGRNRYLIPFWIALWGVGLVLILRKRGSQPISLTRYLNQFSAIALTILLASMAYFSLAQSSTSQTVRKFSLEIPPIDQSAPVKPDIYYIILDSYPREDVLLDENGIDISGFTTALRELGFVMPPCSRSNYNYTLASVASTLNMEYLDALPVPFQTSRTNRLPMRELILHSRVAQTLSQAGYQTVSVEHKYRFMEWEDADIFYEQPPKILFEPRIRSFERILFRSTAIRYFIDSQSDNINTWNRNNRLDPQTEKYNRIKFTFERLADVPAIPGPTLFFTNIDAIHAPLVFALDGSYIANSTFDDDTQDRITERIDPALLPGSIDHLNRTLLDLVKQILRDSATPPVIILQGDHAISNASRNLIFQAIYLPEGQTSIPENWTPVNTFRMILNTYFDANLPILPDRAYTSDYGKTPYLFTETMDKNSACAR